MIRLYGLKNCDTCRKALKELEAAGKAVEFTDIRAAATEADFWRWLERVGAEALINRRSTTWRGLSDSDQAAAGGDGALALLVANPALVKRPVIEAEQGIFIGWKAKTRAALLGPDGRGAPSR